MTKLEVLNLSDNEFELENMQERRNTLSPLHCRTPTPTRRECRCLIHRLQMLQAHKLGGSSL